MYVVQEKNICWCLAVPFVYSWHTRWISSHCFIICYEHPQANIRCQQKVSNIKRRVIAIYITNYVARHSSSSLDMVHHFLCAISECQNSKNHVLNVEWEITVSQIFWVTIGTHTAVFFLNLILSVLASLASYCYFSTLPNTLICNNMMLMASGNVCKVSRKVCLRLP